MGVFKFEWMKLGKKKLFLVFSFILLAANLLTVYAYEKYTDRFFYGYQHRERYEAYLDGDETADIDDYYKWKQKSQEEYMDSYPEFIDGMEGRAKRLQNTSFYQDKEGYAYQNLVKSCKDFKKFSGISLEGGSSFGLEAFAEYNGNVLFVLVFLAVLTYYVLFYERDMSLLLLLKGSKKGHTPLAAAKLSVMVWGAIFYTVFSEGSAILLLGWMYGYGNLGRAIQSLSMFRNCAFSLTVGEMLLLVVFLRVMIAAVFACLMFCIGMFFKNEFTAAALAVIILGLERVFSEAFSISGSFGGVKCVNPFYCWDLKLLLGEYYNFNIFGHPVGKNLCAVVVAGVLLPILCVIGILAFNDTCQVRTEGRGEVFLQWFRRKTGFMGKRLGLLYYEFYKMLVQQKKGIVLAILFFWGIYEIQGVFAQEYYATAREASYHYYIGKLQGLVTEETFAFMEEEEASLQAMWDELAQVDGDETRSIMIMAELERYEEGFSLVQDQLEMLQARKGDIKDKYLLDEMAYADLWRDTKTDIILWFSGAAAVLYFISGIYALDEKKKMQNLLRSTRNGRKRLNKSRNCCAVLCTAVLFLIMELPLFLRYAKIDGFATAGQKLCDITNAVFSGSMPLGFMVAMVFLLKAISFFAVCFAGIKLSRAVKGELPAIFAGIGCAGVAAMIAYHFGWDFNMFLIHLL